MIAAWIGAAWAAELALGRVEVAGRTDTAPAAELRARIEDALRAAEVGVGDGAPLRLHAALEGVERRREAPSGLEVTLRFELVAADGAPLYAVTTRGYLETSAWNAPAQGSAAVDGAVESLVARERFQALLEAPPKRPPAAVAEANLARCAAPARRLPGDIPQLLDAVVVVRQEGSVGTGFVLSPDGWVATAAHVVADGAAVTLRTRSGAEVPATVVRVDAARDAALLHADGLGPACLPIEVAAPELGAELFLVGTPAGLDYSVSKGIVSSMRTVGGERLLQTDAPISPGSSGGPVLDVNGRVRGLVRSKLAGEGFEGLGFATTSETWTAALRVRLGDRSDDPAAARWSREPVGSAEWVDAPDPSRFAQVAARASWADDRAGLRTAGVALGAVGAAAVVGTWLWASGADHASDTTWTGMTALNVGGWAAAGGGAALLGVSFLPAGETSSILFFGVF